MTFYYIFKSLKKLDIKEFKECLGSIIKNEKFEINFFDDFSGYFYSDNNYYFDLDNFIKDFSLNYNNYLVIIVSHSFKGLTSEALRYIKRGNYFKIYYLFELVQDLLKENSNDINFKKEIGNHIKNEFINIPDYIYNEMILLIKSNNNVSLASSKVIICHRNTLINHINYLVENFNLDVREFCIEQLFLLSYYLN